MNWISGGLGVDSNRTSGIINPFKYFFSFKYRQGIHKEWRSQSRWVTTIEIVSLLLQTLVIGFLLAVLGPSLFN